MKKRNSFEIERDILSFIYSHPFTLKSRILQRCNLTDKSFNFYLDLLIKKGFIDTLIAGKVRNRKAGSEKYVYYSITLDGLERLKVLKDVINA